jgi:hypothetical protein
MRRYLDAFALTLLIVAGAVSGIVVGLAVGSLATAAGFSRTLCQQLRASWPWLRLRRAVGAPRQGEPACQSTGRPSAAEPPAPNVEIHDRGDGVFDLRMGPNRFPGYPGGGNN